MSFHHAALRLAFAGGAFVLLSPWMARGAVVTLDLVCVLNNTGVCVEGPSFGTVTLTDTAPNTVRVDTDLYNPNLKFMDMMFQVAGIVGTVWNLTDPVENPLALGTYSIPPNAGTFNLGSPDNPPNAKQGWNGKSGYVGVVQATGLSTASFITNNGGTGQYYVGLHIQSIGPDGCTGAGDGSTDCLPGQAGSGSLKIGGVPAPALDEPTPEPWTLGLVGTSLMGLSLLGKRRR
ncbi:MAG: hypothetical protein U0R19_05670 [Bryobacteraceae bacterium]